MLPILARSRPREFSASVIGWPWKIPLAQLRSATKMEEGTDARTDLFPSALCNCSQRSAIHVLCYCNECNGKAVNRRTQLNHIRLQKDINKLCMPHDVDLELNTEGKVGCFHFTVVRVVRVCTTRH